MQIDVTNKVQNCDKTAASLQFIIKWLCNCM